MKPRIRVKAKTRPHLTVVRLPVSQPDELNTNVKDAIDELISEYEAGMIDGIAIVTVGEDGARIWNRIAGGYRITLAGGMAATLPKCFED